MTAVEHDLAPGSARELEAGYKGFRGIVAVVGGALAVSCAHVLVSVAPVLRLPGVFSGSVGFNPSDFDIADVAVAMV